MKLLGVSRARSAEITGKSGMSISRIQSPEQKAIDEGHDHLLEGNQSDRSFKL